MITVERSKDHLCLPQIDFEIDAHGNPLAAGDIITDQWATWGVHVTTDDPVNRPAMIFDSANPTGNVGDLRLREPARQNEHQRARRGPQHRTRSTYHARGYCHGSSKSNGR